MKKVESKTAKKKSVASKKKDDLIPFDDIEEVKEEKKKIEEEPKWYHYVIILSVFLLLGFGTYFGFNYYSSHYVSSEGIKDGPETYLYQYERGNITYNIYFSEPVDELLKMNFTSQPSKEEVLVTKDFLFSFDIYNGTDNGQITKSSVKLMRFFETVYRYDFGADNVVSFENVTCKNSNRDVKVVTFDPYGKEGRNGVYFSNSDNCLKFVTDDPQKMEALVDYFIYRLLTRE